MSYLFNLLSSVAVIGSADGPSEISVAGEFPFPALTLVAVVIVLLIYAYASKVVRAKKAPAAPAPATQATAETKATPAPQAPSGVELTGVDEKTAAVIMAIVSDKSGIPINRLAFKSIKLVEDK